MARSATGTALLAAALIAVLAATVLDRWAPAPAADSSRGTEDAFAKGLQRRELPPRQAPIRWTTAQVAVAFENLPRSDADLDIAVAGHRGPILVSADGLVLGVVPAGASAAAFPLPSTGRRSRTVLLDVPVFTATDGRQLGTRLQRISVRPRAGGAPGLALLVMFAGPAIVAAAAARSSGLSILTATAFAGVVTLVQAAILWPSGLLRSPYAVRLAVLLAVGLLAASASAWWVEKRTPGAGRWALVAMTAAWIVQGVLATSPAMIVSDAVFHANNLSRVAGGDLFPTSVTQHSPPFRFPYGVSFYAVLSPLLRAGLDGVALVRWGAALAGIVASAALFVVVSRGYGPSAAGLAIALLQFLPGTFDVAYSYGNLSNGFGQSMTIAFFAWWAGGARLGWPAGALLLATAAMAHFSSLVVAAALAAGLLFSRRGTIARDRTRTLAVVAGLGLAAIYYSNHLGLIAQQLPRLLGTAGAPAAESGILASAGNQLMGAVAAWGLAAIVLAWAGRPAPSTGIALDRDLAAWWIAAGALALPALVSPLEVRYLYALAPAVAIAAGRGAIALHEEGGARRLAASVLVGIQVVVGAVNLAEAVYFRYRR